MIAKRVRGRARDLIDAHPQRNAALPAAHRRGTAGTGTTTTLNIGGVSASFTSTTAAAPSGSSSGGGGSLDPVLIALLSAAGLRRLKKRC
jgi:hypothetical protein